MSSGDQTWTVRAYFWLAGLTLPLRRPVFWLIWHARWLLGRDRIEGWRPIFQRIVGTPADALPALERRFCFIQKFALFEKMVFKSRPTPGLIHDLKYVAVDNEYVLDRLAEDGRSIIFAPLHMGANIFAMVVLIYKHFRGRRMLVIRKDPSDEDTLIYERIRDIGSDVRFMFVDDKAGFIEALKFARRNCIVICFCDLPPHFGSPAEVELLGRPARLAMGLETLARALDATIVPLTIFSRMRSEVVEVGTPFEVGQPSPAERARVARRIADHVTRSIRRAPDQWELWWLIEKYLDEYRDEDPEDLVHVPAGQTHRYEAGPAATPAAAE